MPHQKYVFDLVEVEAVCQKLQRDAMHINSGAVAKLLGISTTTLNRSEEAKAIVDKYRSPRKIAVTTRAEQEARLQADMRRIEETKHPVRVWRDPSLATWTPEQGKRHEQAMKQRQRITGNWI